MALTFLVVDDQSPESTTCCSSAPCWCRRSFFGRVIRRVADQPERAGPPARVDAREAVRAERDRIARELHDVIAHSLSAMVVQTAAAEDLVRTDPAAAGPGWTPSPRPGAPPSPRPDGCST